MATSPLLFRTSTFSQVNLLHANIRSATSEILRRETELSTGFRVRQISDDPVPATRAIDFRRQIARGQQYMESIALARSELEATESALADATRLMTRAREIYLTENDSASSSEDTRAVAANEIAQLIHEAVEVVNRTFRDRYLFAGNDGSRPPALMVGDQVSFVGSLVTTPVQVAPGVSIERDVSAFDAFGVVSSELQGRMDLDPAVSSGTKLADVNGSTGVTPGSIMIDDGLGNNTMIDLTGAESLGDVLAAINAPGTVTATIDPSGTGIELMSGGTMITVTEVNGGTTAQELGILKASTPPLFGDDLDPRVRLTTPLTEVAGGAGIDLSGIVITNGTVSKTISLAGAQTVEDLLNAINGANAHVVASINESGNGIDLKSTLSGTRFTVAENGGTTAADLGWTVGLAELPLDQLNNGFGILALDGVDFQITLKDGGTLDIDVSGATTVQDVLDIINNDSNNGGRLTASVAVSGDRLELVDSSGGTGDLRVSPVDGSFAAQNLGIEKTVPDPGVTLTGDDLQPAGFQVDSLFNSLALLRDALIENNDSKLEHVGAMLERSSERLVLSRGEVGSRMERMNVIETRLQDHEIQMRALVSRDLEVDLADAVIEFEKQRNVLEASLSITARILNLSLLDFL